jgi:hypothetical protein
MSKTEIIRNFSGKVVGTLEYFDSGDAIARDFYGKVVGRYTKVDNRTRDFYGKVVSTGNTLAQFLNFDN